MLSLLQREKAAVHQLEEEYEGLLVSMDVVISDALLALLTPM